MDQSACILADGGITAKGIDQSPTAVDLLVAEIFGNRLPGDVTDGGQFGERRFIESWEE